MKRIIAVLMIIMLSLTCFAAGDHSPNDIFQEWAANGFPDYVSGVWSNDGSIDNLTFALVEGDAGEQGKAEILAMLSDSYTVEFVYQKYSRNYLCKVQEELYPYFEKDLGLVSSGLDEMNNCIDIGILAEMSENAETLAMVAELVERYGEVFDVDYNAKTATLTDELVLPLDDVPAEVTYKSNTGYAAFAIAAALLCATVFAIYALRRRTAVKATNAGDVTEKQMSLSEVETTVKNAEIDVPDTLDEKIKRDIEV